MGQQVLHWSAVVQLQWVELVNARVCMQLSYMECWSSLWVQRAVGLLRGQQVQWWALLVASALEGLQAPRA